MTRMFLRCGIGGVESNSPEGSTSVVRGVNFWGEKPTDFL